MATILDVSVLSQFSNIFAFLFVLVMVYGIMSVSKFFGGNKGLQGLLAFLVAIIVLITPKLGMVFITTIPWLTLFFILLSMIFLGFKMFGVSDSDFRHAAVDKSVLWTVITIIVLIMLWGVVQVYGTTYIPGEAVPGQPGSETTPVGGFTSAMGAVLFHPKVLGAVFLLLLAMFTISTITGESVSAKSGGDGGHH